MAWGFNIGKLCFDKVLLTNFWQSIRDNTLMNEIKVWHDMEREEKYLVCVKK